jgi:hypothetical protein
MFWVLTLRSRVRGLEGLEFRVWGLGFVVWSLGFRVWKLGLKVWGLVFGV